MKEALYYTKAINGLVQCLLCPEFCLIPESVYGNCGGRINVSGKLLAANYGKAVTINIDPIEKKPLYHYYPGSDILSLGANSCNLHCEFCQNFETSQNQCKTNDITPIELLNITNAHDLKQVAFTYTEPFTWYEYILDCCKLLVTNGIRVVLITNGYINQAPLIEILPYIVAMNIDLKSIKSDFYTKYCRGKLEPVLDTIKTSAKFCHIEITNLIIPDLNDDIDEISELVDFIKSINSDIPLHFSRYFPSWKCEKSPTPMSKLKEAFEVGKAKLNNVYVGNIENSGYTNTHCRNCKAILIERNGYKTDIMQLSNNKCSICGSFLYGIYQ